MPSIEDSGDAAVVGDEGERSETRSPSVPSNPEEPDEPVPDEVSRLRFERAVSEGLGLPWAARGPKGPELGGPGWWRGQNYRWNTGKWANRAGAASSWGRFFVGGPHRCHRFSVTLSGFRALLSLLGELFRVFFSEPRASFL